ncbi:hypothetical protein PR048_031286 [Dryococelus australis]|uniref:Uncharacterized protein n=1 Tax=Dryococelus australis TaxID=614101 RepID=A0ABQ9G4V2_9NEOP|nr:hypothetical protein PR048_031286 [Dryococelus australis]
MIEAVLNIEVTTLQVSAPERKGKGNGRTSRIPADDQHRPARLLYATILERPRRENQYGSTRWEASSVTTTHPPSQVFRRHMWSLGLTQSCSGAQAEGISVVSTSRLEAIENQRNLLPAAFTLASHQSEPGSIPGRVNGFSHVGIVRDDYAGRWAFSGIPPPLRPHSGATPYSLPSTSSALKTSVLGDRVLDSSPGLDTDESLQFTSFVRLYCTASALEMRVYRHEGATGADWLACPHPIKTNWAQSSAGSPDFRVRESYQKMSLVGGSFRRSPA